MTAAAETPGNPYRHVVFTAAAASRRPLNLGAPTGEARHAPHGGEPVAARAMAGRSAPHVEHQNDDTFLAWLFAEAGLSARHYRSAVLRRRLPACLRALRVEDLNQARRVLRRYPQLVPVALDALLLGVTDFFRDPGVYACLARELPSLFPSAGGRLRVWSAGCSEGAELYSVAILLAELGAPDGCELLGTDCRPDAVAAAAAGRFNAYALRGLSPERLARFFEPVPADAGDGAGPRGGSRRVGAGLRGRVAWRRADAVAAPEPGPWHLVLCRNFGMYLEPAAAEQLWRGLGAVLSPGGLLVLGKAERPSGVGGLVQVGPCVYRRCGVPS